ncbi:uncharacterized protein BDW70DRAFT_127947 [Aspergillus foveolatus]|uniref:uncharacterized protein n=1 Tax=Aspergillus foveolatus TaxID=210207 RepID=UPI003CCD76C7
MTNAPIDPADKARLMVRMDAPSYQTLFVYRSTCSSSAVSEYGQFVMRHMLKGILCRGRTRLQTLAVTRRDSDETLYYKLLFTSLLRSFRMMDVTCLLLITRGQHRRWYNPQGHMIETWRYRINISGIKLVQLRGDVLISQSIYNIKYTGPFPRTWRLALGVANSRVWSWAVLNEG